MKRSAWVIGGIVAATLTSSAHEAAARNIFDDFAAAFFGAPARQARTYYYVPAPEYAPPPPREYPEVSSKPAPPVVHLDPGKDSNWFLKDPTLRRGDIVVTGNGVLVYNGRSSDALRRADFASLGGESGGTVWQRHLKAAAAGGRSYFAVEGTPPSNQRPTAY